MRQKKPILDSFAAYSSPQRTLNSNSLNLCNINPEISLSPKESIYSQQIQSTALNHLIQSNNLIALKIML
jgi:hypothetical protein